ncbi:MAG TPA: hypothetical protein VII58_05565, partial [Acidobacteriaceae bacterium]
MASILFHAVADPAARPAAIVERAQCAARELFFAAAACGVAFAECDLRACDDASLTCDEPARGFEATPREALLARERFERTCV